MMRFTASVIAAALCTAVAIMVVQTAQAADAQQMAKPSASDAAVRSRVMNSASPASAGSQETPSSANANHASIASAMGAPAMRGTAPSK